MATMRMSNDHNTAMTTMANQLMAPTIATIKPTHAIVTKEEDNNSYTS